MPNGFTRRSFLRNTSVSAASLGLSAAVGLPTTAIAKPPRSANERVVLGWIGCGIRYHNLIGAGSMIGPTAAICDVDMIQAGRAVQSARIEHEKHKYPISITTDVDYRHVLDRSDIDAVVIATPDHWHTKIAIEAMQAGKDVYCEKPLTLTIKEGRQIAEAEAKTGRVLQVGTMQRSEFNRRFGTAAAMVRAGRVGNIKRVTCALDGAPSSGPIPKAKIPPELNWDMWLGQAPMTDYLASNEVQDLTGYGAGHTNGRTHGYFRWWYEYSGGKMTDWGAHHVDVALWALNKCDADIGPYTIEPISVTHPNPMDKNGMPVYDDRYNTATNFQVRVTFADGIQLDIVDNAKDLGFTNGIMFEGDERRFFVNRGKLTGKPVEELKTNPLPEGALKSLYGGRLPANSHLQDFADCIKNGYRPVSDVESHHRNLTVCHATNIAMRLGRKLTFDPSTEQFIGDTQANSFVAREQRKGYEINWPA